MRTNVIMVELLLTPVSKDLINLERKLNILGDTHAPVEPKPVVESIIDEPVYGGIPVISDNIDLI